MPETNQMKLQRLKGIETQAAAADIAKNNWRDAKEHLAQARKEYERESDALVEMIREKLDAPLFPEEEEPED